VLIPAFWFREKEKGNTEYIYSLSGLQGVLGIYLVVGDYPAATQCLVVVLQLPAYGMQ